MFYAERLADWTASLQYDHIPKDVVEKAKACIYDWLCIAVYGRDAPWSKALSDMVAEIGGKGEATVFGHEERLPAGNAAMVNAVMALSYDLSDTYPKVELHPSCSVIAAALAMAEKEDVSGRDLIVAVAAGYEVITRVAAAMNQRPTSFTALKGLETNSIFPPFGAVASAGKILGLDKNQTAHAFGLAGGSMGATTIEYLIDGNWTYRWNSGRASHNAVLNALMAQKGYQGPLAIFEGHWDQKGRYGVINALAGDMIHKESLVEHLGETWNILDMAFKSFGCCHYNQGYMDAMIRFMNSSRVTADQIDQVTAYLPHFALFLGVPRKVKIAPKNLTVAQWSLPFVLATAMVDGHLLDPKVQLSEERLQDERILDLSASVQVEKDESLDKAFMEEGVFKSPLKVQLKDGRTHHIESTCKGFHHNPLTEEEIEQKFDFLTKDFFSKEKRNKVKNQIKHLDTVTGVRDMIDSW